MKKLIITIAILMGVSAANLVQANDDHMKIVSLMNNTSDLNIKVLDDLKFRLTLTDVSKNSIIEIQDKNGMVLYKEFLKGTKNASERVFAKIYDLSKFKDGKYTFKVTDGEDKFEKTFEIKTQISRNVASL